MITSDIKDQIANSPNQPGVYFFFDADDILLYIGKSVNLKKRLTDHFRDGAPHHFKIVTPKKIKPSRKFPMYTWDYFLQFKENKSQTVIFNKERKKKVNIRSRTSEIKYVITDNEDEAYTLEGCLISAFRPLLNRSVWDYPYVEITTTEKIPRVRIGTFVINPENYLFGPFNVDSDIDIAIRGFLKVFPICCHDTKIRKGSRYPHSCFRDHLHLCLAPCKKADLDMQEYIKRIEEFKHELENSGNGVTQKLEQMMQEEVEQERFEAATQLRDEIQAIKKAFQNKAMPTVLKKYYSEVLDVIQQHDDLKLIVNKLLEYD
jgi:excinuclease ABC subunit C